MADGTIEAQAEKAAADHPRVVAVPPLVYLAGLVVGGILEWLRPSWGLTPVWRFSIGPVLVIIGLVLAGAALREFRRAGTHVEPYLPTTALVTAGPYRLTRNPIYLGMTLGAAGVAVLLHSLWMLAMLVPVLLIMHFGVVLREEEYLAGKFGEVYSRYMASVRRWIF